MHLCSWTVTGAWLASILLASGGLAQTDIDKRLAALEQEIRLLKAQRDQEKEQAADLARKSPIVVLDDKGLSLKSGDGNHVVRLGGQLKADSQWFIDDQEKAFVDSFRISSARPVLSGTLFREFDFVVSGEFTSSPSLTDGYIEWKHWPALKLRAGRFKQPFGLERLQSDVHNVFTSLGLPSQLVPARDNAVQVSGDIEAGLFQYAVSYGNGVVDGSSGLGDTTDDKDLTARLWTMPLKKTDWPALQGLGVGLAVSYGHQGGQTNAPSLASYKSAGGNTFFSYQTGGTNGVYATGDRYRFGPQFCWYYGRLGLLGEYVWSTQQVQRPQRDAERLRHQAWQLMAAVALTDDLVTYRGIAPKRPFDPMAGHWGAFELAVRVGRLVIDDEAFTGSSATRLANPATSAEKATAFGLGLNWYLNRNLRTCLDWDHTEFEGGGGAGKDRDTEDVVSTRLQVAF